MLSDAELLEIIEQYDLNNTCFIRETYIKELTPLLKRKKILI